MPKFSMSLNDLLVNLIEQPLSAAEDAVVVDLAIDSRKVIEGSLFIAYPGLESDGRNFILDAQKAGATAVVYEKDSFEMPEGVSITAIGISGLREQTGFLADRFFGEPSSQMQIFGVTGTNGKTTCSYLLAQALQQLDLPTALIGTLGTGPLNQLDSSGHTTPDVISIHRLFALWLSQDVKHVCMEVSSHALDQGRVNGVQFFSTLFTNLSHDHLDYHGTLEDYQHAKQRLFTDFHSELVVTNNDDQMGVGLIDIADSDFIASYGQSGDVVLHHAQLNESGMSLEIETQGVDFEIESQLIGTVNIPNVLLLVTTLLALSVDVAQIQRIVANLKAAPGRMQSLTAPDKPVVVIDYAHTPDALDKALLSVKAHCQAKLWCVFGCGGDRDQHKRSIMGKVAVKQADFVVVTNDNPRSELPETIAKMIQADLSEQELEKIIVELDRAEAIKQTIENAAPQDWIVVAGKGHESTQIFGDTMSPFSDEAHVRKHLGLGVAA